MVQRTPLSTISFLAVGVVSVLSCGKNESSPQAGQSPPAVVASPKQASRPDPSRSVVRVNSTLQSWNTWQPWEKDAPIRRRALGAIVAPGLVLTTAEMAADAIFIEFESIDGTRLTPAKALAIDLEANLALLCGQQEAKAADFFQGSQPFSIAEAPGTGDDFALVQAEANGQVLETSGKFLGVELSQPSIPGGGFLTYKIKASMQNAASSYSLPVLRGGRLCGMLFSYDAKDQLCEVGSTEIMGRFIREASDGTWDGFPSLGVSISTTEDPSFRQWLKLGEEQGGIYVSKVRKDSAAASANIRPGDVILSIKGLPIDRRGYCSHPTYGNLLWAHWIRGETSIGESIELTIWRDGAAQSITATLNREDESKKLVPLHLHNQAPNFLLKGGLVFQELSLPLLKAFGKDWETQAPLDLLDAYRNPDAYESKTRRIVILSGVIPTPATVGYEQLRSLIVGKVNGKPVLDMQSLLNAFESTPGPISSIEFATEPLTIHLDENASDAIDAQLLQRGIRKTSRTDGKP